MNSIQQMQDMTGKTVVITGGAGHLGKLAVKSFLELGANVAVLDNSQENISLLCEEVKSAKLKSICCDISQQSELDSAVAAISGYFDGKINVLINNAAFVGTSELKGWAVPFEQQSFETWKACFDVNVSSAFYLCQQLLPLLKASDDELRSIINISSIYAMLGPHMSLYEGTNMGNPAAYAASKSALQQFGHWLATVAAPDIRVNNIVLGGLFRNQPDAFVSKYQALTPLNRMGQEEDVLGALVYLGTNMSRYVTGQDLVVDGGFSCW